MLKQKLKKCKFCNKDSYIFSRGLCQKCSKLKVKEKAKEKRKIRLEAIPALKKKARYWFQRFIRLRDLGNYSCYNDNLELSDIRFYDACHYLKFELYPEAGFDEDNVHGGSKAGNIKDDQIQYRRWLVINKGENFVNNLENKYLSKPREQYKWSREFLNNVIDTYKEKCNQLENK